MLRTWLKILMPLIIAVVSLIGIVVITILQFYSASNSRVEYIVQDKNNIVIPAVQKQLEAHDKELDTLREEVAYWQGVTQHKTDVRSFKAVPNTIILDLNEASDTAAGAVATVSSVDAWFTVNTN